MMKLLWYILVAMAIMMSCQSQKDSEITRRVGFDDQWKFHYGDISGASEISFDDSQWRLLNLPHDWSVEMPFSRDGTTANGQTVGGTGWYRKSFHLKPGDNGKIYRLYFEGAYMETDVWLNGQHVGYHPYGYTSFSCDLTPYCKTSGEENILAVRVRNEGKNSRWYSGSGIYRHVWFESTNRLYVDMHGLYVTTPVVSKEKSIIQVVTQVVNETGQATNATVQIQIKDAFANIVGKQNMDVRVEAGERKSLAQSVEIQQPSLWSVETPVLYTCEATVMSGKKKFDQLSVAFGIRSIDFSAEKGFLLNGEPVKLKGGNIHHDNGLLGAASIDRAEERKVELMKANGFNAVRCAHNPPAPKFLEACDRLGLLVIDEAFDQWQRQKNPDDYHRFFDEWHERDLASMVERDRNHPSITMWSIGNEIRERADSSGVEIAARLKEIVRRHDDTRPVTAAINDFWDNRRLTWAVDSEKAFRHLDIAGYNYVWQQFENDMRLYPDRIIYGAESTPMERAAHWDLVEKYPCIIGDFVWTALDYLGEAGIGHAILVKNEEKDPPLFPGWPWFNGWCGDIDICGDAKPQSALRNILWNNSKIEMAVQTPVPHGFRYALSYWGWPDEYASWNWSGHENRPLEVRVFTRYPSVRLYLNGKLMDEQTTQKSSYTAVFKVNYQPGELKAVAIDAGVEKENVTLQTTGAPVKIRLTPDRPAIQSSRNDLAYTHIELINANGCVVPDSDRKVQLTLSGSGEIAATGNASPTDMESFRSSTPATYRGKALVIIRSNGNPGTITLSANAEGLPTETVTIETR